jgi:hypothetical protein
MHDATWGFFVLMFLGQMGWLIAATSCERWLRENDPSFQPPGFAARFFIGRLFTSFGPMSRYAELRKKRNEPTTLVMVFWGGFVVSIIGVIGIFASL